MRVEQPIGTKGSLMWLQKSIQNCPELLQPQSLPAIEWLSPVAADSYAEYRDIAFLERMGIGHLSQSLNDFWPKRGPQWDALGRTPEGLVLVEAKAHLKEFFSSPSAASNTSRNQIQRAFVAVQSDLGVQTSVDWSEVFYQYANRLTFLWWLRRNGINAKLLFVSFLNDTELNGPTVAETWHAAFAAADYALGLPSRHQLKKHIHHVMPDVRLIP